jgi:hypothetical protein
MKQAAVNMKAIIRKLNGIDADLQRLDGWSPSELGDRQLGGDLEALRQHVDNAIGRCSKMYLRLLVHREG